VGRQLETTVTLGGVTRRNARVHLDSRALQVSGRPRIEVAFAEISRVEVEGGCLSLATPQGLLRIEAGDQAETWAERIRTPPTRAKKLGLREGSSVAISGLDDPALAAEVLGAGARLVALKAGVDLLFFAADSPQALARLPQLARRLAPDGALWVVRSKGRGASVSEDAVRTAARSAGLVDVKVVAFSDTQSADKFVIPVSARTPGTSSATRTKKQPSARRTAQAPAKRKA